MVVPNRIGHEGKVTFYGSSFISDPYGRVLVQAPRDQEAVPESYDALTVPVDVERPFGVGHPATAVVK